MGLFSPAMLNGACTLKWSRFDALPLAAATYYADSAAYDAFAGVDITSALQVGSCTASTAEGTWHTQRVGPFVSTGGYDWWKLIWSDVAGLEEHLHKQNGPLVVNAHFSGPVGSDGEPIPLPPVHNHHIHVAQVAERTPVRQPDSWPSCLVVGQRCPSTVFGVFIQHHGDEQCTAEAGGTDCMLHSYGEYVKTVTQPLKIYGELNDVRPKNSTPIEWFYQLAVRTIERQAMSRAVSFHFPFNPNRFDPTTQSGTLMLGAVPAAEDSFFYYTSRMPFGGTLVPRLTTFHAHAVAFQEAFVFSLAPAELGLASTPLPQPLHHSIISAEAGFVNNSVLRGRLLRAAEPHEQGGLVCHATVARERVGASWFDRKPRLRCSTWRFDAGTQFTVVALNGPTRASQREDAFGGMTASTGASGGGSRFSVPQHNVPGFAYVAHGNRTHGTAAACNAEVDSLPPFVDRHTMLRIVLNRGTPRSRPTELERAGSYLIVLALCFVVFPMLGLLYAAAACVFVCHLRRTKRHGASRHHCPCIVLPLVTGTYGLAAATSAFLPPAAMHSTVDNALLVHRLHYQQWLQEERRHAAWHAGFGIALTAALLARLLLATKRVWVPRRPQPQPQHQLRADDGALLLQT